MGYRCGGLILETGTAVRPTGEGEDWCADCNKPSRLLRPVWALNALALDAWGSVYYCRECKKSEWKNTKGIICRVVATIDAAIQFATKEKKK